MITTPPIRSPYLNLIWPGVDEEKASTSFELFDALLECEVAIIVPHLTSLLSLCLDVTKNTSLDDGTRVKFMTFLSWLVSTKKKALQVS